MDYHFFVLAFGILSVIGNIVVGYYIRKWRIEAKSTKAELIILTTRVNNIGFLVKESWNNYTNGYGG